MLTEDDVVDAVCRGLEGGGWRIDQRLTTRQTGVDIIATRDGRSVFVEAKGETSSKDHTNRYGKPFNLGQARSHVARALLTTAAVVARGDCGVIALPDNAVHRTVVGPIRPSLDQLGIVVAWVAADRVASFEPDSLVRV